VDRTKEMGLFSAPLLTAVKHNSWQLKVSGDLLPEAPSNL
jgi:hypothetical protein